MKKVTFLVFSLFMALTSCSDASFYSKYYDEFPSNHWEKTDKKEFEFTVTDDTKTYDLSLKFGHVYDYQFPIVPIEILIIDPTGKEEKLTIDLKIKDEKGNQLAECSGDVCDLICKIKDKTTLVKGNYKVVVSQAFDQFPYLPNVLGLGLNVDISK